MPPSGARTRRRSAAQPHVALHGFLTRAGVAPAEFLRIAREQRVPYATVRIDLQHVDVCTQKIALLEGNQDRVGAIRFLGGSRVLRDALFFAVGWIWRLALNSP